MIHSSVPRRASGYRHEEFGDEVVLYNSATTQVVYLNSAASLVWRLCDGERSVADIRDLLRDAYPDSAAQIEEDLEGAFAQLTDCGAIELT